MLLGYLVYVLSTAVSLVRGGCLAPCGLVEGLMEVTVNSTAGRPGSCKPPLGVSELLSNLPAPTPMQSGPSGPLLSGHRPTGLSPPARCFHHLSHRSSFD